MSDIELKPCPFCGGEAFFDSEFSGVYCHCGAEITFLESDKEAAERWNSRPIEDALQVENERLKKELADLKKEYLLRSDIKKVVDSALEEGIIDFPSLELKED